MDPRFKKINDLLSAYALGQFDKRLSLSKKLDEVDAFIAGVNMLGEELKETTISRNYFNDIFNSRSYKIIPDIRVDGGNKSCFHINLE